MNGGKIGFLVSSCLMIMYAMISGCSSGGSDATLVGLMNGDQLVDLLIENNLGVKRTEHALIDLLRDSESEYDPSSDSPENS